MTHTAENSKPGMPARRRNWRRISIWTAAILVPLIVVLYLAGSSAAFFKGVILPRVSDAIGAEVTVKEASLKPFRRVLLRDLKVQTAGAEPILTVSELHARYSLFAILGGNIEVEELTVVTPVVTIVELPDGTKNTDSILRRRRSDRRSGGEREQSQPPELSIGKVVVSNATFRTVKRYDAAHQDITSVSDFNLELTNVRNGETGRVGFNAELSRESNPPIPGTNGSLEARLSGTFDFSLSPALFPEGLNGKATADVTRAQGAFADLSILAARLEADVTSVGNHVAEVRQLQLTLTPTSRAQNEVRVTGRLDFSQASAGGSVQLTATSLDLTPYYDLFAGSSNAPTETAGTRKPDSPRASSESSEDPAGEPKPMTLPFRGFTFEVDVGELYLREIEIAGLQTALNLDGGRIQMRPLRFELNGGAFTAAADFDLGVAGYRYAISANADQIPLEPLAAVFAPEFRNYARGNLIADLNVQGAGTTGASLQRSLSADVHLAFTNANVQLIRNGKWHGVLKTVCTALQLPGLADSPISLVTTDLKAGAGEFNLEQFRASGPAFAVSSEGSVPIASVLADSPLPHLPVSFAVSREIADRNTLRARPNGNTSPYEILGIVAHLDGTLGSPQATPDFGRIAMITGEQFIGGTAGGIVRGITSNTNVTGFFRNIGGMFGSDGKREDTTNASASVSTNSSATNTPPQRNFWNRLFGPKDK